MKANYTFEISFKFDFNVNLYIFIYFSAIDVIAQLGGFGELVTLALKIAAPLFVLKFMVSFAQIIIRNA